MTKIHVLADETLGGTLREYVEVEREAEAGEKVVVTDLKYDMNGLTFSGDILTVRETRFEEDHPDGDFYVSSFEESDSFRLYSIEYKTLEPTDIVHIEGSRFRLVDRKAEASDRRLFIDKGVYLVLEPIESEASPQTNDDIIANLARRVAELERQNKAMLDVYERDQKWTHERINGVKDDIETWAQDHEKTKRELDDKIEMVIDDIVTLDERLIATEGRTEHVNSIKARRCCGCK